MNREEKSLYRTQRPRFVLYPADGLGRDTYIGYNNGGFWKDNIAKISYQPTYDHPSLNRYHSLSKDAAPFKYYSDGSGRDSYILANDGGLKKNFEPLNTFHLKDFLRTPESCIFNFKRNPLKEGVATKTMYVSRSEYNQNMFFRKIQNDLIRRLYHSEKRKWFQRMSCDKEK